MNGSKLKGISIITLSIAAYFLLEIFVPFGGTILYPFKLLVTILHEFGHAFFTLITGGSVKEIQISPDGSGHTMTVGGIRFITLAGGYLGSAIFGNLLVYLGCVHSRASNIVLTVLLLIMAAISTIWAASLVSVFIVLCFAVSIYFLNKLNSEFVSYILIFSGVLSVIYIIEDFNIGPSSDLAAFAREIPIMTATMWMYVWLAAAIGITYINAKKLITR